MPIHIEPSCRLRATVSAQPANLSHFASCTLPTEFGEFAVDVFRDADGTEHMLVARGKLSAPEPLFVRIHSECYTGEVLGSLKCDCRSQLQNAQREIDRLGRGAVVYLRQEGRGIGLGNKIRAYAEQEKGADTVRANEILGFPADLRDFGLAAEMLIWAKVERVRLNTNNPEKVAALVGRGIEVVEVVPSVSQPNQHNLHYLRTKLQTLGHSGLRVALDDYRNTDAG
ncbi:MAG: GTP cyclohydrolase II [Planctomycetes bacterium]|nr:GTP cyclohydrolase II [Planctomycetota bacterium]MCB9889258.1 GTP cyclohydrolase II [Planctomycetota bacterium]